ncbi:alpha/beta-hydrolase [Neocallimastix californiae]|jgi:acetyl esterase/lipase|uniref:Alpha/beta-hydrolase n=1 Tax=Neocallimastix californiae TaxID=1754190 RepID=A0A1Y2D747_9FUNG|nr:alpha/beta-hydrolase [Neocallimastix californiae]|eukprot:ORY54906.1 alpha/beta-hydrolase [Neocallimastix californiae]
MGFKSMFAKPAEELLETVKKENEKCNFKIPNDKSFHYFDVPVLEEYHCLRMQKEEKPTKKAILFFFGGGFIRGCNDGVVKSAKKYGERSGRDVWLPYYPLCTDHCVKDSYGMIFETYKIMLKEYEPQNIALVGFSSGGAIAIGLCCHINAVKEKEDVPMPGLIIACSPGSVPYSEEEKKKMEELNPLDVMLDQNFMVNVIKGIMVKDQEVPDYMVHTVLGDYTNFPMTHIYYATHEILYAEAEFFEKAFKKYNVKYEMHIKEGMFHCYPSFTFYPEGKEAEDQMIEYLSN